MTFNTYVSIMIFKEILLHQNQNCTKKYSKNEAESKTQFRIISAVIKKCRESHYPNCSTVSRAYFV